MNPAGSSVEDRQLVTALVGHLSLAMQHVRQFELARDTSLTLQRSMLAPTELPAGFAVRYEPAVSPLEIGGDWYDVLPVGDDRIGIIVGDCVGRGLSAAAVMGQLRSSARALLLTGASPARLLEQLDSVAAFIPDAFCTTVFVAILDTRAETLSYSSAGHVPAVLAAPDSQPQLLTDARSVPLAVHRDEPRPQSAAALTCGSTLLLYTDGLVERRDEADRRGYRSCRRGDGADDGMCPSTRSPTQCSRNWPPPAGYDDDVAIVLYRHPGAALAIENEAIPARLTDVRHQLADVASQRRVCRSRSPRTSCLWSTRRAATVPSTRTAGSSRGRCDVEAALDDGHIQIRVADSGSWKTPPADPGTRGRGLLLMRALSEQVDLDGTADGTTVGMRFAFGKGHVVPDADARVI